MHVCVQVRLAAEAAGLPVSHWVERAVLDALRHPRRWMRRPSTAGT
ncbi:MAG: hypothetical protein HYZ53_29520 [Planctomycetes bacterium]|nr:hypothetical protein [Planctomycetota bacterium]